LNGVELVGLPRLVERRASTKSALFDDLEEEVVSEEGVAALIEVQAVINVVIVVEQKNVGP
jgi:hypothetical protein